MTVYVSLLDEQKLAGLAEDAYSLIAGKPGAAALSPARTATYIERKRDKEPVDDFTLTERIMLEGVLKSGGISFKEPPLQKPRKHVEPPAVPEPEGEDEGEEPDVDGTGVPPLAEPEPDPEPAPTPVVPDPAPAAPPVPPSPIAPPAAPSVVPVVPTPVPDPAHDVVVSAPAPVAAPSPPPPPVAVADVAGVPEATAAEQAWLDYLTSHPNDSQDRAMEETAEEATRAWVKRNAESPVPVVSDDGREPADVPVHWSEGVTGALEDVGDEMRSMQEAVLRLTAENALLKDVVLKATLERPAPPPPEVKVFVVEPGRAVAALPTGEPARYAPTQTQRIPPPRPSPAPVQSRPPGPRPPSVTAYQVLGVALLLAGGVLLLLFALGTFAPFGVHSEWSAAASIFPLFGSMAFLTLDERRSKRGA